MLPSTIRPPNNFEDPTTVTAPLKLESDPTIKFLEQFTDSTSMTEANTLPLTCASPPTPNPPAVMMDPVAGDAEFAELYTHKAPPMFTSRPIPRPPAQVKAPVSGDVEFLLPGIARFSNVIVVSPGIKHDLDTTKVSTVAKSHVILLDIIGPHDITPPADAGRR